jgi:hypothetical protein
MEKISLDKWFNKKGDINLDLIHKYFCLEWGKKYKPKGEAFWSKKKPNGFKILKTVKWKTGHITSKICVCFKGTFDYHIENNLSQHYREIDIDIKNIPILKSNLQKCIRRRMVNESIKTAYNFMEVNFLQFIRRLAIIMLEDCLLDSSITTIVWMTSAFPEWEPNLIVKSWLLGIVYYLSDSKIRELCKKNIKFNILNFIQDINSMNLLNKSIIYSLEFRRSYGGMKGDMSMVSYFSYLWYTRFLENKSTYSNSIVNKKKCIKVDIPMNIYDIEKSSIDFHIFPIATFIHRKFPLYSEEIIKKTIWYMSSSVSKKKIAIFSCKGENIDIAYDKIWNIVLKEFQKLSFYFLIKSLN